MRLCIILCCLLAGWPVVCPAEPANQLIQQLPSGCIDWTSNALTATGASLNDKKGKASEREKSDDSRNAKYVAHANLMRTLAHVRMDSRRYATHVMAANDQVGAKVAEMVEAAPVIQESCNSDGRRSVTVRMSLLGGFAQLMLPDEIRQVEPIRQVGEARTPPRTETILASSAVSAQSGLYTGLVVDARGIGAKPAMAPLLVDENGKEVFGSAFVSREYAVQYGVCEYVRTLGDPTRMPRVAPRPLVVKGLHTLPNRDCDIVISNADAARLRDVSENLNFLKQCRVIIIVDNNDSSR